MKKLLMIAVLLGLIVISQSTFSLGMGKIQVDSALDEQLEAYIELSLTDGEAYEEIEVKLASSEDYRKVGLDRSFVPSNIRVSKDEDLSIVRVTSVGPVSEPIISLLLEVNWQNGKLLREYTILLDPPVFSESTASTQSNTNPVIETQPMEEPAIAEITVDDTPEVITSESVSNDSNDSVPVIDETRDGDVVVNSGDTLWSIASRNNYSGLTNHQMMMALYNANPEAFLNNNINQLSKGARLRIPSRDEVASISSGDAFAQFEQHQSDWSPAPAASQPISTIQQESYTDESAEPASTLDYGVELVGGDDTESSAGSVDGAETSDTGVIQLEEELSSKSSENEELSERVNELEQLVEQQQAALEIQDSDLAAVQNMGDTIEAQGNEAVDEIATDIGETTDDATAQLNDLLEGMSNTDETSNDDVWGADQETTSDEQLAAVTDPVNSGNVEDNVPVEQTANTDATDVQPTNTSVKREEKSFLDTALEWVQSNLLYVGIGLLGLLALLFVPKLLRSGGADEDDEGNFLDDIKADRNRKSIEGAVDGSGEDAIDTKLNEPLLEEVEEDLEDLEEDLEELNSDVTKEHNYDPDSLLQEAEESIDDTVEAVDLEDDDEFDLDEFLNQDDAVEESSDDADTRLNLEPVEEEIDDLAEDLSDELEAIENSVEDVIEDADDELDALDIDDEAIDEVIAETEELDLDAGLEDLDDLDLDLDEFADGADVDEEIDLGAVELTEADTDIEAEISLDMDDDLEQELADLNSDDDEISLEGADSDDAGVDFDDLMAEEDSVETKLDLAKAYMGMGENEGAMNLLDEVIEEGNDAQKSEAESLKKEMDS